MGDFELAIIADVLNVEITELLPQSGNAKTTEAANELSSAGDRGPQSGGDATDCQLPQAKAGEKEVIGRRGNS